MVITFTDGLVEACDRYLADRHCVLWGRPFDVHHPDGRLEAAKWFAAQIEGLAR